MKYHQIARDWREQQASRAPQEESHKAEIRRTSGIVMIWRDTVSGWKHELNEAHRVRPNTVAVSSEGNMFIARGGNDWDGAQRWVSVL